jgi:ferredoxin
MRVHVDQDRCCSSGQCVLVAPEVFDQQEDYGVVLLLDTTPAEELHPAIRVAASVCPGQAIFTHDA